VGGKGKDNSFCTQFLGFRQEKLSTENEIACQLVDRQSVAKIFNLEIF
jgi:hypothetical protein